MEQYLDEHIESAIELCLRVLIFALFPTIFLLFTSLDTSGTWNVNRPATKTSTRDTFSALPGSKNFILAKTGHKILFSWSQAFCQF